MKEKGFQLENYRRSSPDKQGTRLAADARLLTKSITGFFQRKESFSQQNKKIFKNNKDE